MNDLAIEAWERQNQSQTSSGPPADLQPSQSPVLQSSSLYTQSHSISIPLLSRSDFLRTKPDFDTDSVLTFGASQLSDFDTESDLPPSQFWIPSSQPSQDIVADSQPALTGSSAHEQLVAPPKARAGISQTTIPDSQDLSNELSQNIVEVPGTVEDPKKAGSASLNGSHKDTSGSSIPSHQPGFDQIYFADDSLASNLEHHSRSQQEARQHPSSLSLLPPASNEQDTPPNPFGLFLTQPAFEPGEFIVSTGSEAKSQSQSQLQSQFPSQSQSQFAANIPSAPVEDTSQTESYEPAQLVSPLRDPRSQLVLSEAEAEFFSASEDNEVVPDSSLQRPGQTESHQSAPFPRPAYTAAITESQHVSKSISDVIKFSLWIADCFHIDHPIQYRANSKL